MEAFVPYLWSGLLLGCLCLGFDWLWRRIRRLCEQEIVYFNVERQLVNVPHTAASSFIRDVANLPIYEQKVHSSRVLENSQQSFRAAQGHQQKGIFYQLEGGWCGFPWKASFNMIPTPNGGFHSRIVPLREGHRGITMSVMDIYGGFVLRPMGVDRTLVVHYESYRWNRWYLLLRIPFLNNGVARWHKAGMRIEMQAIKLAMEASAAHDRSTPPPSQGTSLAKQHLTFGRFLVQELTGRPYRLVESASG